MRAIRRSIPEVASGSAMLQAERAIGEIPNGKGTTTMLRTMIKTVALGAALGMTAIAVPTMAADAPAPAPANAPKPAYSVAETDIGTLLDNPATKAVLDKYIPGMSTNSQIDMARAMTLKQVQGYAPDQFKDETLAKIDADLAKIPPK